MGSQLLQFLRLVRHQTKTHEDSCIDRTHVDVDVCFCSRIFSSMLSHACRLDNDANMSMQVGNPTIAHVSIYMCIFKRGTSAPPDHQLRI